MTWKSFHRRGEVLRAVIAAADVRQDARLPVDVEGVADAFSDEVDLLAALQLRWHTRLAGCIEREMLSQPMDLEQAVLAAWQATALDLPGVRAILDRHRQQPSSPAMAQMMATATGKEHAMLALMSGLSSTSGAAAAQVGAQVEQRARATFRPPAAPEVAHGRPEGGLLQRIRAALAA